MKEIVGRIRVAARLRIIGATVTPRSAASAAHGSRRRTKAQSLNEFIRTSGLFDGVIDFDKATLDPQTGGLRPEFVPDSTTGGPATNSTPTEPAISPWAGDRSEPVQAGPREPNCQVEGLILQSIYLILVSAVISSLPSAVRIVSCTCSPLLPAGIAAETRLPFFGSAFTASSNNTASPRFSVTRNAVAGSMLKNEDSRSNPRPRDRPGCSRWHASRCSCRRSGCRSR